MAGSSNRKRKGKVHREVAFFNSEPDPNQGEGGTFCYSQERMVEEFARHFSLNNNNLSFNLCQSDDFERYVQTSLQPAFQKIPKKMLKRTIISAYNRYKKDLQEYFTNFNGRVAITANLLTSSGGERFICVTCNWVDENWSIQKRIIGFEIIEENYTSIDVSAKVIEVLDDFNLKQKVFSILFYNDLNNDECVQYVINNLNPVMPEFFFHQRCCAYVTDLCVQLGMEQLEVLINQIRELVKWFRHASSHKKDEFKALCRNAGLKSRHFSLDYPRNWKSTYGLLCNAYHYREVLTRFYNENVNQSFMADSQWDDIYSILNFFEYFSNAHLNFTWVYDPSCHTFIEDFSQIVYALKTYENDPLLCSAVRNMKSKWLEYFPDVPVIYCIAIILDPDFKVKGLSHLLEYYYENLGIASCADEKVSNCMNILNHLYYEKEIETLQPISESQMENKEGTITELDEYLSSEYCLPDDFDILRWWKEREKELPILSRIAKDILCVPVSTVALEYSFSAGERVLDEKWSRFSPHLIQVFICKQDWTMAEEREQGSQPRQDGDETSDSEKD